MYEKKQREEFDYESFEQEAISKLRSGKGLQPFFYSNNNYWAIA